MAQNIPFFFGAGGGQPPPVQHAQQQINNQASSSTQHQPNSTIAQQAAFQQNAQLPGVDMSALAGISPEQLAAIGRLFQLGALTIPPLPPAPSAQPSAATPAVGQTTDHVPQAPQISNSTPSQEPDVDMDKEEGELEEDEVGDTPQERGFLRPPPTGPRNRSASPRGPLPNQRKPSTKPPAPNHTKGKAKQAQAQSPQSTQPMALPNGHVHPGKDAEAKAFVLEMVNSGYSFKDLVKELPNPRPLIRMFRQLGLPTSSDDPSNTPSQHTDVLSTQVSIQASAAKPSPSEDTLKTSVPKRPAPVKPLDRNEYLAKLQAAKNKKADNATAQAAPSKPAEVSAIPPEAPKQNAAAVSDVTKDASSKPPVTNKATSKTELARQRLEALKARQAANRDGVLPANNGTSMTSPVAEPPPSPLPVSYQAVSSPTQPGLGTGIADIRARATRMASLQQTVYTPTASQPVRTPVSAQPVVSPPPLTPSRSFSGLPGLFMVGAPSQAVPPTPDQPEKPSLDLSARQAPAPSMPLPHVSVFPQSSQTFANTPSASPASLTVARKRPVASDFDDASSKPSFAKRQFGQSRGASEDESLIIEVSDDEDDEDQMEIDHAATSSMNANPPTKSFRDVGPLRDFPSRPNLQAQLSGQSTPGVNTPGGITHDQMMKEIEEMKRKIAEAERKKNANGKTTSAKTNDPTATAGAPTISTPGLAASSTATPIRQSTPKVAIEPLRIETSALNDAMHASPQTSVTTHSHSLAANRPVSTAALAKQREKDMLKQRLLELERNSLGHVPEAVEATAEEPEPALSSATTNVYASEQPFDIGPIRTEARKPDEPPEGGKDPDMEEGELSDDSISKLYDTQNAQDPRDDVASPAVDQNTRSQSTTTSAASGAEAVVGHNVKTGVFDLQTPEGPQQDIETDAETAARLGITTPIESELPDSIPQDMEMVEAVQDPVLVSDSLHDDEEEDLEEDDSDFSDSEDGDLDRPLTNRYTDPARTQLDEMVDNSSFEEGELDDSEPSSVLSDDSEEASADRNYLGKDAAVAAISTVSATEPGIKTEVTDNELAPELQPSKEEQTELLEQKQSNVGTHYTPYESVLKLFRDYRWHPDFLENVPGGFKSLTYSHRIDPVKPLCRYEGGGGICNDRDCPNQHFRDMGLTDNDLLKILGTENLPIYSEEDKLRWNVGLGAVIREMRTTNASRDANAIAARISEFRREFSGDSTKVIKLG